MPNRVGLFGGTFNPVHHGHTAIARSFLSSGFIDELWVLLTPNPPHKKGEEQPSYQTRLEMLQEAFEDFHNVKISTIESELPKPSYTIQTIRHLKKQHAEITFYYCIGEDSLTNFHTWKNYRDILKECELLVAARPGETHEQVNKEILDRTYFVDHEPIQVSSSIVRERLNVGKPISDLVPKNVLKIIEKEQLYS